MTSSCTSTRRSSRPEYLPTETEREYTACRSAWRASAPTRGGKIAAVNDLITYNLDIEAFVQDWLAELDDPVTLRRLLRVPSEASPSST